MSFLVLNLKNTQITLYFSTVLTRGTLYQFLGRIPENSLHCDPRNPFSTDMYSNVIFANFTPARLRRNSCEHMSQDLQNGGNYLLSSEPQIHTIKPLHSLQ